MKGFLCLAILSGGLLLSATPARADVVTTALPELGSSDGYATWFDQQLTTSDTFSALAITSSLLPGVVGSDGYLWIFDPAMVGDAGVVSAPSVPNDVVANPEPGTAGLLAGALLLLGIGFYRKRLIA